MGIYQQSSARNIRRVIAVRSEITARLRRCLTCKLASLHVVRREFVSERVTVWADTVTGSLLYDLLKLAGLAGILAVVAQCHL